MATKEYFPGIGKIKFEGKESKNPMAFRYYDAEKVINGKKMKDWLKFAMAWWHTLCAEGGDQFGGGTKPALNSCRKWESNIIVSMIWTCVRKPIQSRNMKRI